MKQIGEKINLKSLKFSSQKRTGLDRFSETQITDFLINDKIVLTQETSIQMYRKGRNPIATISKKSNTNIWDRKNLANVLRVQIEDDRYFRNESYNMLSTGPIKMSITQLKEKIDHFLKLINK